MIVAVVSGFEINLLYKLIWGQSPLVINNQYPPGMSTPIIVMKRRREEEGKKKGRRKEEEGKGVA